MLGAWEKRPPELRSLFNPAFCSALIVVAVKEFGSRPVSGGMPLLMSHLLLPIALHTETRKTLPSTTRTSLTHWIAENAQVHIGFADRALAFRSITREAIRFALAGGILKINESCELIRVPRKPRGLGTAATASIEVSACFKASKNLGRWFARVPDSTFLYRLLRILP
ncbi:MAG TPA: three component ABC system middle component [Pirellulales bacterium]|jgi:hypothetical protein|nr:three component ABC system middle component [Pirellulales bacterium]